MPRPVSRSASDESTFRRACPGSQWVCRSTVAACSSLIWPVWRAASVFVRSWTRWRACRRWVLPRCWFSRRARAISDPSPRPRRAAGMPRAASSRCRCSWSAAVSRACAAAQAALRSSRARMRWMASASRLTAASSSGEGPKRPACRRAEGAVSAGEADAVAAGVMPARDSRRAMRSWASANTGAASCQEVIPGTPLGIPPGTPLGAPLRVPPRATPVSSNMCTTLFRRADTVKSHRSRCGQLTRPGRTGHRIRCRRGPPTRSRWPPAVPRRR